MKNKQRHVQDDSGLKRWNPCLIQEDISLERRMFLRGLAVGGSLAALPSFLRAAFMERLPVRTVEKDSFVFENSSASVFWKTRKEREPYKLLIEGLAANRVELTCRDLQNLPQTAQVSDFHCVEGWTVRDIKWEGVRFQEIVRLAVPLPEARYVLFHALGETADAPRGQRHYVECLPLPHLLNPQKECLLALNMNGMPLPHDHGAPLRVIAPYDLAYKSIKFVHRIEFVREQKSGWWTLANPIYPANAPVPASRLRKK